MRRACTGRSSAALIVWLARGIRGGAGGIPSARPQPDGSWPWRAQGTRGSCATMRRTSTLPKRAPGIRPATWTASSRSRASMRWYPPSCSFVSAKGPSVVVGRPDVPARWRRSPPCRAARRSRSVRCGGGLRRAPGSRRPVSPTRCGTARRFSAPRCRPGTGTSKRPPWFGTTLLWQKKHGTHKKRTSGSCARRHLGGRSARAVRSNRKARRARPAARGAGRADAVAGGGGQPPRPAGSPRRPVGR